MSQYISTFIPHFCYVHVYKTTTTKIVYIVIKNTSRICFTNVPANISKWSEIFLYTHMYYWLSLLCTLYVYYNYLPETKCKLFNQSTPEIYCQFRIAVYPSFYDLPMPTFYLVHLPFLICTILFQISLQWK